MAALLMTFRAITRRPLWSTVHSGPALSAQSSFLTIGNCQNLFIRSLGCFSVVSSECSCHNMPATLLLKESLISSNLRSAERNPQNPIGRQQWLVEQASFLPSSSRGFRSLTAGTSAAIYESVSKRWSRNTGAGRLEASYHTGVELQSEEESTGPATVSWDKSKVNRIYLTGNIGKDVLLRTTSTQKTVASTRLAVSRKGDDQAEETDWFDLEMWGGLAESAAQSMRVGDKVQVQGRVKIEKWTTRDGVPRTSVKVVAYEFAHVGLAGGQRQGEGREQRVEDRGEALRFTGSTASQAAPGRELTIEQKWVDFFKNPGEWWDNRHTKSNPNQPDFKRKTPLTDSDKPEVLWIVNRFKPSWVDAKLAEMFANDDGYSDEEEYEEGEWQPGGSPAGGQYGPGRR